MTKVNKEVYPSDNKSLPFVERMKLATVERKATQAQYEEKKKAEAEDILLTVEQFVDKICDMEELSNKFIESVHKVQTHCKVVELFSFNGRSDCGDLYNNEIKSAAIKDRTYGTKYILSESYMKLTRKYFPDRSIPIIDLINAKINVDSFNNGVDLETEHKLIPCIFINKYKTSKFKNGVYISRDGINYNIQKK